MGDLRPPLDAFAAAFGVGVVLTPPGGAPVNLVGIWDAHLGQSFAIEAEQLVLNSPHVDLRKDQIADVPNGSTILSARAPGDAPKSWTVIRVADLDPQYHTVLVI